MKYRSSRPEVFCENGALKNFAKFTGEYLCQSLFFNKVAGLGPLNTSGGCFWKKQMLDLKSSRHCLLDSLLATKNDRYSIDLVKKK